MQCEGKQEKGTTTENQKITLFPVVKDATPEELAFNYAKVSRRIIDLNRQTQIKRSQLAGGGEHLITGND